MDKQCFPNKHVPVLVVQQKPVKSFFFFFIDVTAMGQQRGGLLAMYKVARRGVLNQSTYLGVH